jgi:hypothetical protein
MPRVQPTPVSTLVSRYFENRSDSIDYGPVDTFAGRRSLGIRIRFQSAPPDENRYATRTALSIADPWGQSEGPLRNWVGQFGTDPLHQCWMLGQSRGAAGGIIFLVGDGTGNVSSVASARSIFRCYDAGREWRDLVAMWDGTAGTMSLHLDGLRIAHATGQTSVARTGTPLSHLCLGHQPAGPYNASPGLRLFELRFWPALISTGRLDPETNGGIVIVPKGPVVGSMHFDGGKIGREEFMGPEGRIAVGMANFAGTFVQPLSIDPRLV